MTILTPFAYDSEAHEASVLDWRRRRLARLTASDGWLSLVGRFPLEQGKNRAGSGDDAVVTLPKGKAPAFFGDFERNGSAVIFTPASGLDVKLKRGEREEALAPETPIRLENDREGVADRLLFGSLSLELTARESGLFVRVRDPESPARLEFPGLDHYPIDPKWRIVAKLEAYEPNRVLEFDYEAGTTQRYVSPGAAVFEVNGETYRVDPVFEGDRLYLVFWDPSARDATYGAGRFLYAPLPEDGRLLLDFNLAFSPPCAFTPYAACPLAPSQNRLSIRVEAGEKSPH